MALTTTPALRSASYTLRQLPFPDVMDYLDITDASMTPLFTMLAKEAPMKDVDFETQVDSWGSPQGAIGYSSSQAIAAAEIQNVMVNRRQMGNVGQIFRRAYGADWIADDVVSFPGTGKGVTKEAAKRALVYMRQDMEVAATSFDQTATYDGGTNNTGALMAGCRQLMDKNNQYANANAFAPGQPTDLHYAPPSACVAEGTALEGNMNMDFVENMFLALRQSTQRKLTYMWLCGLGLRKSVTGLIKPFAVQGDANGVAGQTMVVNLDMKDTKLGRTIEVVFGDYGTALIKDTDFIGTSTTDVNGNVTATRANRVAINKQNYGLVLSTDKWAWRFGKGFENGELADDGANYQKYVRTFASLMCKNPTGSAFQAFS